MRFDGGFGITPNHLRKQQVTTYDWPKYPDIWCAICRRRADELVAEVDGSITVRCHRESERITASIVRDLIEADAIYTAFVDEARFRKLHKTRHAHNKKRRAFLSDKRNGWKGGTDG